MAPRILRAYRAGLAGVSAKNPEVKLRVQLDPALGDEPVLQVDYPEPTANPASRDVWCEAETQDWSGAHALACQIKPAHALRLSVSFFDRHRVAYTIRRELESGVWQALRIGLHEFHRHEYFQPPDAELDSRLDVSLVTGFGFSPQDDKPGSIALSAFTLVD